MWAINAYYDFVPGPTPSLWDDINSSIQKLDPMHVDVSNGCYSPGPSHKYRGDPDYRGDHEGCADEGIKSEPMYLGEGEGYVNDNYNQVDSHKADMFECLRCERKLLVGKYFVLKIQFLGRV